MPLKSHTQILDICAIALAPVKEFSYARDNEKQNTMVKTIVDTYGLPGLRTLWLCQGMDFGFRDPVQYCPPATQWWLSPSNPWSEMLQQDFKSIELLANANTVLGVATCSEYHAELTAALCAQRNMEVVFPTRRDSHSSLVEAVHVRALAQRFFPHVPGIASPLNPLYFQEYETDFSVDDDGDLQWEHVFHNPAGAFLDDPHALKYFVLRGKPLPNNPPSWLLAFEEYGDDEWNVYKALNISSEQAYELAVQNARSVNNAPGSMLSLPDDVIATQQP